MKKNFLTTLLAAALCFPVMIAAQSVTIKEVADRQSDYTRDFFRPVPDRYLTIHYASPHGPFSYKRNTKHTEIIGYDAKLNEVYNTPIKELSGNKYLGSIVLDKKLHIFYSDNKKVFRCELDPNTGAVTGTPANVFTATDKPISFYSGFSADSAYCYAMFRCAPFGEKDEKFNGVVLDRKMNVVTKFSFKLEKLRSYIDKTTCVLSPEGLLFIVNSIKVKPSKKDYRPLQFLVTEINKEGNSVTTHLDQLPQGQLSNMVWKTNKNGISFTGLLSATEKEGYKTILSGEFNSWQKKITGIKQAPFSEATYWQRASGQLLQQIKSEGINAKAELINSFEGDDGSLTLVLQPTDIVFRLRGNYSYTDAYTFSLYIVKVSPARELNWVQVIPLNQHEPFFPMYSSAISLCPNKKDLYLFFHDSEKNAKPGTDEKLTGIILSDSWDSNIQLVAAVIKDDGSLSRSPVGKNIDPDHHLAPREEHAVCDNEIIYTSYNRRNAGRSTYKLGLIKIQ
jgi:hypothetical protein